MTSRSTLNTKICFLISTTTHIGLLLPIFLSAFAPTSSWADVHPKDQPFILILSATYCGPCKIIAKNLAAAGLSNELSLQKDGSEIRLPIITLEQDLPADQVKILELGIQLNQPVPQLFIFSNHNLIYHADSIPGLSVESIRLQVAQGLNRYIAERHSQSQNLATLLKEKKSGKARVVFIGTGNGPETNPIFVGYTIRTISEILTNFFGFSADSSITLYGSGKVKLNDAVQRNTDGHTELVRLDFIRPDASFTPRNLEKVYLDSKESRVKNLLFIYSGHGSDDGVATWGAEKRLSPKTVMKFDQQTPPINSVIISGVCHGGIFAQASSCGFFGAAPTTEASGCWQSKDADIKDYASDFFKVIADAKDPRMTLEDAHWRAVLIGETADTPYTTLDSLADDFFQKVPEKLPDSISLNNLLDLAKHSTEGERGVLKRLTHSIDLNHNIYFKDVLMKVGYGGIWGVARVRIDGKPYSSDIEFKSGDQAKLEKLLSDDFDEINRKRHFPIEPKYPITRIILERTSFGSEQFITEKYHIPDPAQEASRSESAEFKETPESKALLIQLARRLIFENEMRKTDDAALRQKFESVRKCERQNLKDFLF